MEQPDLYLVAGEPRARQRPLTVRDDPKDWHSLGQEQDGPLSGLDLILTRQGEDLPFGTWSTSTPPSWSGPSRPSGW